MRIRKEMPAFVVSVAVHATILFGLSVYKLAADTADNAFLIETVIDDEQREQEEFVQKLDIKKEIAEALNFVEGGASAEVGGSNSALSKQTKLDLEDVVKNPDFKVDVGIRDLPGPELLSEDLGVEEVTGEVGAVVDGYGTALSRLTQELIRTMRERKLLVVWLFDESGSMKDDQREIKQRIHRVYEELKLVQKNPQGAGLSRRVKTKDILLTSITSFGKDYHVHTRKPTADMPDVLQAIDRIPVDQTGAENMSQSLLAAIKQYKTLATRGRRKLVLIVVSDESGDDGVGKTEQVIHQAKLVKAPIYVLGRESVFGNLYAYVRWQDPSTKANHLLPVRRGPETAYAELLQYDGFRRRRDSHMSGFGPYDQVRLARDTGGIFFQLPHERQDLNDFDAREYELLHLREYVPSLEGRRRYLEKRTDSTFRRAVWEAIQMLDPHSEKNKELEFSRGNGAFSTVPAQFLPRVAARLKKISYVLSVLTRAQKILASVRELRETEPSLRWRANYDLMVAQLFAYRVRMFEYGIAVGEFSKTLPKRIKNPQSNRWYVVHGRKQLIMPNEQQAKSLGVTADELKQLVKQSRDQFQAVIRLHPNTPWAKRAEWELGRNFGVGFRDYKYTPPPPPEPGQPRPKPTPLPKL